MSFSNAASENAQRARETRDAMERRGGQHAAARELRSLMERAQEEAAARGATAVEAEHVLLALAAMPDSRGGAFLVANGLDRESLEAALLTERRRSLGSVGAPQFADSELTSTRRKAKPRWGASSREAFDRGMRMARSREHVNTINFVVGALIAELGTVPRMLSLAGLDRHLILGRATAEASKGNAR